MSDPCWRILGWDGATPCTTSSKAPYRVQVDIPRARLGLIPEERSMPMWRHLRGSQGARTAGIEHV